LPFLKKSNSEEIENSLERRFHHEVWCEVALEISTGVLLSRKARFNPYRSSNAVERLRLLLKMPIPKPSGNTYHFSDNLVLLHAISMVHHSKSFHAAESVFDHNSLSSGLKVRFVPTYHS
jgi:hypothetical protein